MLHLQCSLPISHKWKQGEDLRDADIADTSFRSMETCQELLCSVHKDVT